jgi:aspartyl-tRNA(Asn)/glutamyl-tRNA(Gln) amidotransferase subunit A
VLSDYAEWLAVPHRDRGHAWASRLSINAAELEIFRTLPDLNVPPWRGASQIVKPASGEKPLGAKRTRCAIEAHAHARNLAKLALFTYLPPAPLQFNSEGFLSGVPIVIKDLMDVAGAQMTGGAHIARSAWPTSDALVVRRLRERGASIVGMTNLHELAYGVTSANVHYGTVCNPIAPHCIAGGSSGGSAAAIAAGVVDAAVGTDTAGSIRIPAACCGVVGFKPTYDAVPRRGVLDLAPSLDHVGPLGRTVQDCAALFAAMTDERTLPLWGVSELNGLRVGRLGGFFDEPVEESVRTALDEACLALEVEGAVVQREQIGHIEWAAALQFLTLCVEANEVHAARLRSHPELLGEDVRVRLEIGYFLPGSWYIKAQRLRSVLDSSIDALFRRVDLLICPTMRMPAPTVGTSTVEIDGQVFPLHTAATNFTMPFNLTGLPAISIPWGASTTGAPIGLQLVGRRGHDWDVLAAAERLEARARSG